MNKIIDLRKLFLQQFIQEVLKHATQQKIQLSEEKLEEKSILPSLEEGIEKESTEKIDSPLTIKRKMPAPVLQRRPIHQFSSSAPSRPLPYKIPQILLHQRPQAPKVYLAPPTESWLVNMKSLARIQPLLTDQTITTVECPGPGMPIMIARGTYVQSTPVHFKAEEIKEIIKEVSARTKIPLNTSGVFTASIGDIIITAVLSEFVGTRFVIQKKPKKLQTPSAPFPRRR